MNYDDFCTAIIPMIKEEVERRGAKMRVFSGDGPSICIYWEESKCLPAVNLWKSYRSDLQDLRLLAKQLVELCLGDNSEIFSSVAEFSDKLQDREYVLTNCYRVLLPEDYKTTTDFVRSMFLDLQIAFRVDLSEESCFTVLITTKLADSLGVTYDDLYAASIQNESKSSVASMEEALASLTDSKWLVSDDTKSAPMYVVTCREDTAAGILHQGVCQTLVEKLGNPFVVIPSSIHEVLAVKYTDEGCLQAYRNMLLDVNKTYLEPHDVLSSRIYVYKSGTVYAWANKYLFPTPVQSL